MNKMQGAIMPVIYMELLWYMSVQAVSNNATCTQLNLADIKLEYGGREVVNHDADNQNKSDRGHYTESLLPRPH